MTLKWCFIVLFSSFIQSSIQVPSVDFKLEPNGFRLSLKDETGIRRVSFQVNRNREFKTFSQGEFYGTVTEKTYNQWSYKFDQVLKPSDVLHIWTNVQYGGTNYRLFSEPILVSNYKESTDTQSATRPPTRPPTGPATRPPTRPPTNPPTTPTITEPESCDPSITEINDRGKRVCKDELIFEENFDTYDSGTWQNLVRLPLEESDNEFVLYDTKPKIENGFAIFKPILKADYPLSKANGFRLEGCTYELDSEKECQITRGTWNSMPPVVVPRIQTKKSFNFKYGKVEIRAKMPKGDWLVPLLLLEPVVKHYGAEFNEHGQLRVAYIRGNVNSGDEIDGSHLYGGPIVSTLPEDRDQFLVSTKRNSHFGDDFHVYTLIWTNTKISLYVDDLLYGERTGPFPTKRKPHNNSIQPFDKMFYLSLGVIAGGFGDFPDNIEKPWENTSPKAKALFEKAKEDWLRTWTSPELTVDYVRVYAV